MSRDGAGLTTLFDIDGTLVDTTVVHAQCWHDALRTHEHIVPMAVVHRAIGMGSAELLDHLLGDDRDRDQDDAMSSAHRVLYRQHWERLLPLPRAVDLVRACAGRGARVVLASSAQPDELAMLRNVLGVEDVLHAVTGAADVDAAKPAADLIHVALEKADTEPADAVFVGDAVWDAIAAKKAGVGFVGVSCGAASAAELWEAGALEVWDDPADLLTNLDRSRLGATTSPGTASGSTS